MIETVCPLCGLPRPRNAKRCACNYTFEYDQAPAGRPERAARPGPARGLLAFVALAAAVGAAVWFHTSVGSAEPSRPELGFLMIAGGIFAVCGSIFDWQFFMAHRKARFLALFLGRTGTRFFYAVLGGALAGAGIAQALL